MSIYLKRARVITAPSVKTITLRKFNLTKVIVL